MTSNFPFFSSAYQDPYHISKNTYEREKISLSHTLHTLYTLYTLYTVIFYFAKHVGLASASASVRVITS
jgi:hypothetical protein